jgi:hypothetical protein
VAHGWQYTHILIQSNPHWHYTHISTLLSHPNWHYTHICIQIFIYRDAHIARWRRWWWYCWRRRRRGVSLIALWRRRRRQRRRRQRRRGFSVVALCLSSFTPSPHITILRGAALSNCRHYIYVYDEYL